MVNCCRIEGEIKIIRNLARHCRSPNIVRVIKSRRLRWAGHLTTMEEFRSAFKILVGQPAGKRS